VRLDPDQAGEQGIEFVAPAQVFSDDLVEARAHAVELEVGNASTPSPTAPIIRGLMCGSEAGPNRSRFRQQAASARQSAP
jgi:hypothetical protein